MTLSIAMDYATIDAIQKASEQSADGSVLIEHDNDAILITYILENGERGYITRSPSDIDTEASKLRRFGF